MDNNDAADATSQKPVTSLHPAYSVTNIQTKIRTLDGTKVTYSSWTKLFKLHAVAYKVLDHLDNTPPPPEKSSDYASWKEIDALVLQWIYSTISDDLLVKIEKIFLSNKKARAAALETKFVNLTLSACSSLDDYCQQLKDLANQVGDVDQPVTESRLVLQLEADWDLARSMLNDEVIRQAARQNPQSVLVAPTASNQQPAQSNPPPSSHPSHNPNPSPQGYQRGRGRGRGQGY
ncbi:uncharacterized protein LOC110943261 [Helianthus annuus]|uniref:uncharacterized protein LOC110943261 n=1 Tax=Helianthus annuus TaxID=4232 RepID=UPI000B907CF9|nr:uncharacterized protein LOC110943261 [Helianthus annuus]